MMTQQDITVAAMRGLVIVILGQGVIVNTIKLFFGEDGEDKFTSLLALVISLPIIYFAWTL